MNKPNCYAHHLGECTKISKEHIVSQCIFKNANIHTSGLPIPAGKPVPISSLTAKILCSKHNSALADLDSEICILSEALSNIPRSQISQNVHVSGPRLERWLLKVVAGTLSSGWLPGLKVPPPRDVVRSLFGLIPLPPSVALYGVANVEKLVQPDEAFSFYHFSGTPPGTMGFFCTIQGLPLFFSMGLDDPEEQLRVIRHIGGFNVATATVQHHPPALVVAGYGAPYLTIQLDWH